MVGGGEFPDPSILKIRSSWSLRTFLYYFHQIIKTKQKNKWGWGSQFKILPLKVIQYSRICLAMQGTWVQSLVRELRSPMPQSNRLNHNYWTHMWQLEPALHNERSWTMQWRFCVPQLRPNSQINKIIFLNVKQVRFQRGSILKIE